MKYESFITGSYAYGTPTPDSDIDMVILVEEDAKLLLEQQSETRSSVRFGRLNLILCNELEKFETWKRVTSELQDRPETVTRDEAIAEFERNGIEPTDYEKTTRAARSATPPLDEIPF